MALWKRQPQLAIPLRPPGQWRALLKWLPAGPYRRSTLALFLKSSQTVRCAFKALCAEGHSRKKITVATAKFFCKFQRIFINEQTIAGNWKRPITPLWTLGGWQLLKLAH